MWTETEVVKAIEQANPVPDRDAIAVDAELMWTSLSARLRTRSRRASAALDRGDLEPGVPVIETDEEPSPREVARPIRRTTWQKPVAVALTSALFVLLAIGGIALLTRRPAEVTDGPSTSFAAVTTVPADGPYTGPIATAFRSVRTIDLSDVVYDLAFDGKWLWATTGPDSGGLVRIDPATGSIDQVIDLEATRHSSVEVGEGAVWVAHGSAVVEFPGVIATPGRVVLSRIDPVTGLVVGSVEAGDRNWDGRPLAVAFGSIWLGTDRSVVRVDPGAMTVTGSIPVAGEPVHAVAAGAGSIWIATSEREETVLRVDPETLEVIDSVRHAQDQFAGGGPMVFGYDALWIGGVKLVVRVDPGTLGFSVFDFDPECCGAQVLGLAAGRLITALDAEEVELVAVDPETGDVDYSIFTASAPVSAIVGDDNGFWAAESHWAQGWGRIHRFEALGDDP
jgi:hypothetical protein